MAIASPAHPPVVLVVDDEPLIRFHLVDIVEAAGFSAVEASNADDAIVILSNRNDIRIIVTDIQMPGSMDGLRLARVARNRWPPLEIIVISAQATPRADELPARGLFFSKPIDEQQLSASLKALT